MWQLWRTSWNCMLNLMTPGGRWSASTRPRPNCWLRRGRPFRRGRDDRGARTTSINEPLLLTWPNPIRVTLGSHRRKIANSMSSPYSAANVFNATAKTIDSGLFNFSNSLFKSGKKPSRSDPRISENSWATAGQPVDTAAPQATLETQHQHREMKRVVPPAI